MNSILENIAYIPCNTKNHGGTRSAAAIKYLVYHYTGNDGDRDTNNAQYYQNYVVESSAHYFVDDDSVTQSVRDTEIAWAVGGKKWSDCPQTGGGKLHGFVTNTNSISIEMCDTSRDGQLMATEATLANAIALGHMLMERYHIPFENVVRHFDVTGKHCPAYFMDEARWAAFKARLAEKEEPMEKRYNTMQEISDECPWATETIEKLIDDGIIKGNGEKDEFGRPVDLSLTRDMLRLLVWNDRLGYHRR